MGASYFHIGDKDSALKKFEYIIAKKLSKQEVSDSKQYIQLLNTRSTIGIIASNKSNKSALNDTLIHNALVYSGMYEVIDKFLTKSQRVFRAKTSANRVNRLFEFARGKGFEW